MATMKKTMTIAKAVGKFVNGPQRGVMSKARFEAIARRFSEFPRRVPLITGEHTVDLDNAAVAGWVDGLRVNDDGDMVADVTLNSQGTMLVVEDLIRGASIFTISGRNPDGSSQGEVLHYVLLTNNPFIKDLNIAASQDQGLEGVACFFTALEDLAMSADEKDTKILELEDKNAKLEEKIVALKAEAQQDLDKRTAAALKEKNEEVIALKAESLQKDEEIENLQEQLANARADKDKESALIENVALKEKDFLRDVRAVIDYGLAKGTLLASEVVGYAGSHPLDLAATKTWLKASRFFDASMPNPEQHAFGILKHMATKTKPRVHIGAQFQSGKPQDHQGLTMSDEERDFVRKQGFDPDRVAAMTDSTTMEEWKDLPTESKE